MAASVDFVEVGEAGVGLLGPAPPDPPDFAGKRGEPDRELDLRARLSRRVSGGLRVLPVLPGRGGPGAGQLVQRDVVENVIPGQAAGGLPVQESAGDLVVAVGVVVEHPGRHGDGRVQQYVADRLRPRVLLDEVAAAVGPEGGDRLKRRAFLPGGVRRRVAAASPAGSRFRWIPASPSGGWRPMASVTAAPASPPWAT